jgi:hypothetical protein
LAGRRFWPLVSVSVLILTVLNGMAAVVGPTDTRLVWLIAASVIFALRIVTLSYFAPVLMRIARHDDALPRSRVQAAVGRWVRWSPARIPVAAVAWILLLWVFSHGPA